MIISANLINFQNSRFDVCCCARISTNKLEKQDGCLFYLTKEFYAPFLLDEVVRPIVVSF